MSLFKISYLFSLFLVQLFTLASCQNDGSNNPFLIGDLRFAQTTDVGIQITNIILGVDFGAGQSNIVGSQSAVVGTDPVSGCKNSADPCCIWYAISEDLTNEFRGPRGRCNDKARAAIRLGFHDAGPWSQSLANQGFDFGGADGSIALFQEEIDRPENNGLQSIIKFMQAKQFKYKVGMADLIQFAAKHATVTCPLGPRIRTYIGRKDAIRPAMLGLMPDVNGNASVIRALFKDKTFLGHELVALLGAHTVAKQFHVDPTQSGRPLDTTPGIWDIKFYQDTMMSTMPKGTFRFPSDINIMHDPFENIEWSQFAVNQTHWNADYSQAYIRLSLLGVNNINNLTECTQTLPPVISSFAGETAPGDR